MDNRSLAAEVQGLALEVAALNQEMLGGVLQRMADYSAEGIPASWGAGGNGVGSHADPTATAALMERRSDIAQRQREQLEAAVVRACRAVRQAAALAALYPEPHPASVEDRAALGRLNRSEPGCTSCARTTGPAGTPRWEPPDSRLRGAPTDVAGLLGERVHLCRWCNDATARWGRLPTTDEVDRHHRVGRVPWPSDVERPA